MIKERQLLDFPFINFGKMFTLVVIVNYQAKTDDLVIHTTLPKDLSSLATLSLPEGASVTYGKTSGDLYGISIPGLTAFLGSKKQLKSDWRQVMSGKPTIRRVETTPFVQGLFDWIRQYFIDNQEKAPALQWGFKQQTHPYS